MNKFRRAIGLNYDGSGAPTVSAQGEFLAADEVVRIAKRYGVPIIERAELAQILAEVPLDEEIPQELYEAVAIILQELERQSPG